MPSMKRLLALVVAVLLLLVPAAIAQGAPGGGPGKPPDTGNGGGGGGNPNKGAGQKLGDLYADLWVVARDVNGVPVTTELGGATCLQPITDVWFDGAQSVASGYPYATTMYYIPLVGDLPTVMAEAEDEDELEPCDVQADYAYLVEEVDLGRLNLGRAPERVLRKQLGDVELFMASGDIALDASGRFTRSIDDIVVQTLDSPLANLAAFQSILNTGLIGSTPVPIVDLTTLELTAAQLAAGAPKEGFVITVDTVQYLNRILGIPQDTTYMPTIPPIPTGDEEAFLDFSGFSYTRSATFPGCVEWYPIGSSELVNAQLADVALVGGELTGSGIDGYVKFAEDAHQVLVYLHALGDNVQQVDPITKSDVCPTP